MKRAAIWLAATALAAAATVAVSRAAGAPAAFSQSLPFVVAIIFSCGWIVRDTGWLTAVMLQVPLSLAIVTAVPHDSMRMLGCGLSLAFAIASALWSRYSSGALDRSTAGILLLAPLLLFRLVEVPPGQLIESLVIVAGCAVLLIALAQKRILTPVHWMITFAVGVAVPLFPARLAAVPLLLAALAWLVRSPVIATPLAAVVLLSVAAGRWSWPLAVAGMIVHVGLHRFRLSSARFLAVPGWWPASVQAALRPLPFGMAAIGAARSAPAAALGAGVVIAGGAMLRPALAILYGLAAAVLLAAKDDSDTPRYSGPAAVIAMLMLAMYAWSGSLIGTFPLPLSTLSLAILVAGAAVTMMHPGILRTSVLPAAALVGAVVLTSGSERPWEPAGAVLRPGESVNLTPASLGNEVSLLLSGGNLLDIRTGHPVADLEVISVRGRAYRRTLSVGEISDWAALRQEHWFVSEHGAPAAPFGPLNGYGASAHLIGAGSIAVTIPEPIGLVRLTMRSDLREDAMLHVDALRVEVR